MTTKGDLECYKIFTDIPSMFFSNYIEQCEQAKEIQKLRQYKKGDWYYTKKHKDDYTKGFNVLRDDWDFERDWSFTKEDNWITHAKGVWLPTQEQLQEMSSLLCNFPCQILTFLNDWIKENEIHLSQCGSMNELWLAFVMKEKYNKIWDGQNWHKE